MREFSVHKIEFEAFGISDGMSENKNDVVCCTRIQTLRLVFNMQKMDTAKNVEMHPTIVGVVYPLRVTKM